MLRKDVRLALAVLGMSVALPAVAHLRASQAEPPTYSFKAEMMDADNKAKQRSATIVVTTQGVDLVDPETVNETARIGQGHLHYRVDNGPIVATIAPKLSFHELTPGAHTITVMLAANDHRPLSAPVTFTLKIP